MFPFEIKHSENRIAVITDEGSSFSFRDIRNFSKSIYKLIPQRCLVFCLSQNTVGSLFGYISFLSNSIVPLMLDASLESEFLQGLIKTYRPQYLWLPDDRANEFTKYQLVFTKFNYSLVKLEERNNFGLHPDLAILLTTSGSTGTSKLVKITYENLKANAESISSYLSINEQERPITTLPMWYSYGLSVINSHLLKEATILLTSKTIVEKDFWTFLKNQKTSSLSGVPYTFQMLKKLKFFEMSFPSLKTLTQAGGKLNDDLNKCIAKYALNSGKRFFVMYGQTEATARMSYLPPEYAVKKTGSIGLPLPGSTFKLVDEYGNEIQEAGFAGELVYKGKNVSMGYSHTGDDLIKDDDNQGVLFTGDLAKRDEDNFYYIVGRKKRFIKLFGNRLNLDEAENLLENITPHCVCTGKDDNMVIFTSDKTKLAEIKEYIAGKTGIHPSAFSVRYCDEIPKNAVGKINYASLEML